MLHAVMPLVLNYIAGIVLDLRRTERCDKYRQQIDTIEVLHFKHCGSFMADAFEKAVVEFKRTLTPDELNEFAGTTLRDLEIRIMAIQSKQKSSRTMQNLARIKGFLEAMETYSKVLDVFVNVNDFVAFIWVFLPRLTLRIS